jgi:aspartate/methionine/tyrosine aminotransferase
MPDVAKVSIYNVVTPVGIAQPAAAAALTTADDGIAQAVAEWERRRDVVVTELEGLPLTSAAGGWSMLLDVAALGLDSFAASERLLARGRIAATPMRHWGDVNGERFLRFVFSNEPVARLAGMGQRVRESLGSER